MFLAKTLVFLIAVLPVAAKCQTVDASFFPGNDAGAKINSASQYIRGNGTILVPDSLAGEMSTVTLGQKVNLIFTGSGTFTGCDMIQPGSFSHVDLGNVTLRLSGSECTGISQQNTVPLQVSSYFEIRGGTIDCVAQPAATGIYIGNHATARIENTTVVGCTDPTSSQANPTAGVVLYGTQFGEFEGLHLYGNFVGLKIYSVTTGGGNSNTFNGLQVTGYGDARTPAGVMLAVLGPYNQGGNHFYNFNPLSNSVAAMAIFGANGTPSSVYVDGGSPEVNASGAESVQIDGFEIKRSSTYVNFAYLYWNDISIGEATANPVVLGENHSQMILKNPLGYGNSAGQITACDATSKTIVEGAVDTILGATFCNSSKFY